MSSPTTSPDAPNPTKNFLGSGMSKGEFAGGCGCSLVIIALLVVGAWFIFSICSGGANSGTSSSVSERPTAGLGISRPSLEALYQSELGFDSFKQGTFYSNPDEPVSSSQSRLVAVELVGPSDNLRSITVGTGFPYDSPPETLTQNITALLKTIEWTMPEQAGVEEWFLAALDQYAAEKGQFVAQIQEGNRQITFKSYGDSGLVSLTVEAVK